MPLAIALELLLTGDPVDAERAAASGSSTRWSPTGGALDAAVALAERIAANGPLAVPAPSRSRASAGDWTLEQGWKEQGAIIGPVFGSEDAREGATAFAEKRAPVWKGR